MARESGTKALQDAGITYDKIEQAYVGYVYGIIHLLNDIV
jgi:acetyl-CoA acyltransferase